MDNPVYLKGLIKKCSDGAPGVADHARGLQFFIVKGGGEGFLSGCYAGKDASRMIALGAARPPRPPPR